MTVINRDLNFIYLKSKKSAGTAVEAHLLTRTPLGGDIWHTAGEIVKYGLPLQRRHLLLGKIGETVLTAPRIAALGRIWPWRLRIQEHHSAPGLAGMLGGFWKTALKVTNVRNPWDLMVSAWQWRRDGRGGHAEPIPATFHEWLAAALSGDPDWRDRVVAYDPHNLLHPFVFIDGRCVVDVLIRQEAIDEGFSELGDRLGVALGSLQIREKQSRRKREYRSYYTDELAESVGKYFADITKVCGYRFE